MYIVTKYSWISKSLGGGFKIFDTKIKTFEFNLARTF